MADGNDEVLGHVQVYELGEDWQVRLTVGVQTFDIGPRYETQEEADWMCDMFIIALSTMFGMDDPRWHMVEDDRARLQ